MARKPNFDFERQERDKAKAAKKAAKAEAKSAKKDDEPETGEASPPED
ncbi:hypothetical protein Sa4125_24360 [Aureimonas sp. SA4125]|nr:hypothetical protein [Aureimonas sp. SA4125]BDA84894.1 hypothetical protein Sa4125_24360 [Aureimonas sp. SA4125]